jgi:hypothetical protein
MVHCRWLSDYNAARPYLQQEQRYLEATTRQWAQQARQLLQDIKQHNAAVQVDNSSRPELLLSSAACCRNLVGAVVACIEVNSPLLLEQYNPQLLHAVREIVCC